MSDHAICHVDISAADPAKSATFYNELFGWPTQSFPDFNYVTFAPKVGAGGGFAAVGETTKAGQVLVYVSTDDIDASLAKAESLGAKAVVTKTEIPGIGWFGVFVDPTGNQIGLFTSV